VSRREVQGSAGKPSECANTAKKNIKRQVPQPGNLSKKLNLRLKLWPKKDKWSDLAVTLTKIFNLGFEQSNVNAQNLIFYFIKYILVILYYI
jgi:hypothetical protein